jgi:hypothetical protein
MMNNRLQEQDSENATMKQEIATMLIQQQNTHTADMQALYDRMMLQMTTMFTFPQQPASFHACEPYTQESTTTNSASNNNLPQNTKTVKRQDTRPSPTKRKPTLSTHADKQQAYSNLDQNLHMDVERSSPTIEDVV